MQSTNKSMRQLLLISLLTAGLTACGGGDSGGSDGGDVDYTPKTVKAIDGYLIKAQVYADVNGDGVPQASESIGYTGNDGSIQVPPDKKEYNLIVVADPEFTVDSDTNAPVSHRYVMISKADNDVITPFTHIEYGEGQTLAEVAAALNLPTAAVTGDYVEGKATGVEDADVAHATARYAVDQLSTTGTMPDYIELSQVTQQLYTAKAAGDDLDMVKVEKSGSSFVVADAAALKFNRQVFENKDWKLYSMEYGSPDVDNVEFRFTDLTIGQFCIIQSGGSEECTPFTIDSNDRMNFTGTEWINYFEIVYANYDSSTGVYSFLILSDKGELNWLDNSAEDALDYKDVADINGKMYGQLSDEDPIEGGTQVTIQDTGFVGGMYFKGSASYVYDDVTLPNGKTGAQLRDYPGFTPIETVVRKDANFVLTATLRNSVSAHPEQFQLKALNPTALSLVKDSWVERLANR